MSQYSKTTKQQLDAYERTFSTTLNTNYKNAFIQCKKTNTNCSTMKGQLNKVNDSLNKVKNLAASVESKVNAEKSNISNYESTLTNQETEFNDKLKKLNSISSEDRASKTLRKDRKATMIGDYLTLAYYVFTNAIIIYLLHKQYNFSALYLLAVFFVILLVIFILAWFGIPYT